MWNKQSQMACQCESARRAFTDGLCSLSIAVVILHVKGSRGACALSALSDCRQHTATADAVCSAGAEATAAELCRRRAHQDLHLTRAVKPSRKYLHACVLKGFKGFPLELHGLQYLGGKRSWRCCV